MSRAGDTFSFPERVADALLGPSPNVFLFYFFLNRSILCRYKMSRDIKGRRSSWRSSRVEFCRCTAKEREREKMLLRPGGRKWVFFVPCRWYGSRVLFGPGVCSSLFSSYSPLVTSLGCGGPPPFPHARR